VTGPSQLSSEPASPPDLAGWREQVRTAERRGELLDAVDLAERGLEQFPEDLWLKHRSVLALARAGASEEAASRFARYGLAGSQDEDVAALGARIVKDLALAAAGEARVRHAARARDLYEAIYRRTGGYYPAINAATLSLVAREPQRAHALALEALELLATGDDLSYYAAATTGEAHLILGDELAAVAALQRAAGLLGGDYGALATTRRQLRLVCDLRGVDPGLLRALAGPAVAHFCGHRIAAPDAPGRFTAAAEGEVATQIAAEVAAHPPGYAYGALAGGADILWAEALLANGTEIHVVLPFAREEFVQASVVPSGPGWVARFERCLASARTVTYATDDAFLGDDVLYRYGTELAMGLALLRARYLDAEVRQLAVWDGGPALGAAGTAIDVATWQRGGHEVTVVEPGPVATGGRAVTVGSPDERATPGRVVRSILFADVKDFSRLSDEQSARFGTHVLGAFADVLNRLGDAVLYRNTWGDALVAVLDAPGEAAGCALGLQEAMASLDLERVGLPSNLALRLGAHVGPVFATVDPVVGAATFTGSHVSRTARIEPVTPPGEVYVTEPFAAALELQGHDELTCDYVGHMPAAKDYGRLRMYRLRRRGLNRT